MAVFISGGAELRDVGLVLAGFFIGMLGTLLGLGGGFMIVPLLLLGFGFTDPRAVGTSHFVISLNALSGAIAYDRQRKIDYRIALIMAGTATPAVILATLIVSRLGSAWFRVAFSVILAVAAVLMLYRKNLHAEGGQPQSHAMTKAMALSMISGFAAGMLGVGGGVFHVPIMCAVLGMSIHRAAATSHFILLLTSTVAATMLALQGDVDLVIGAWLGVGVLVGAQAGAWLSPRLKAEVLKKAFAVAVIAASCKMMWDGVRLLSHRG